MKKIYKTPEINVVSLAPELMQAPTPGSIGTKGGATNDDTESGSWEFGGNGGPGVTPESKGTGRFWDDEY